MRAGKFFKIALAVAVQFGIALGIAALAVRRLIRFASSSALPVWELVLLFCIGAFAVTAVGIIMHELGHLISGLFAGMQFASVSFLFVKIYRYRRKIKVKFEGRAGVLGACEMLPDTDADQRQPFKSMVSGGIVASFFSFVVSAVLFAMPNAVCATFFGLSTALLWYVFAVNAMPAENIKTDGSRLLMLKRNAPPELALIKYLELQACMKRGDPPADFAWHDLYELPPVREDDPDVAYLLLARYLCALDSGDLSRVADADIRMRSAIEELPAWASEELENNVFFDSLFLIPDGKFVTGNSARVLARLYVEPDVTAARILAWYFYKIGDTDGAFREMEEARELSLDCPFRGLARMELRLISDLEAKIAADNVAGDN